MGDDARPWRSLDLTGIVRPRNGCPGKLSDEDAVPPFGEHRCRRGPPRVLQGQPSLPFLGSRVISLPTAFRIASKLRGARAVHPRGVVMHGTWRPVGGSILSGSPLLAGPKPALLRLSHSIGLPPSIPEIVGFAIKVLDAYGPGQDQDLVLISSCRNYIGRRLILPGHELTTGVMSSVLPYDVDGVGRRLILARARAGSPSATYADVVREGPERMPVFEIRLGRPDGPMLASLHAEELAAPEISETIRYDPWNTGPELQPRGVLNRLRQPTYAASQEGWGAPAEGWRATR
jgi:hypothetical protein